MLLEGEPVVGSDKGAGVKSAEGLDRLCEGRDMTAISQVKGTGFMFGLQCSLPFRGETWEKVRALDLAGRVAAISDPQTAAKLIADPRFSEEKLRTILKMTEGAPAGGDMPPEARDRCTTCAVVIDRDGMAVSLIESVSAPYGAGVVLEGTGILLNNRMAGFNNDPASDNCVAPMKRPANTLAPCIVTKNGKLVMSVGTPGTVGQTCTLAQFLARVLACGEDAADAAGVPRWSVDFQGKLVVEDTMDEKLRHAVIAANPEARAMREGWISFGSIKLAAVTADGFRGVADHRRVATTAGW